jgi:hypothetical protein
VADIDINPHARNRMVLNAVAASRVTDSKLDDRRNRNEQERFVDRLITRAIEERADGISGPRLWAWLEMRSAIRGEHNNRAFEAIKPLLVDRADLARSTFDAAVAGYSPAVVFWRFGNTLREFLPFSFSAEPLRWLTSHLVEGISDAKKRDALYELAFSWVYGNSDNNAEIFERLYDLADAVHDLRPIRDRYRAEAIQSWQAEDRQRAAESLESVRDHALF